MFIEVHRRKLQTADKFLVLVQTVSTVLSKEADMSSSLYILSVLSLALASVLCYPEEDVYSCNTHTTDYTPTVWAPTGFYPTPTTLGPTTTPGGLDGGIVLIGGEGHHQGNVMVNYGGDFGAILSCEEYSDGGGNYGWCKYGSEYVWSCAEAEVIKHKIM